MASITAARRGDLTQGPIAKQLILYAFPLMVGSLLQQLYTLADSVIVGNFVGKHALAALGATSMLSYMMISLFTGISVGVSVVVSQYFGAKGTKNLRRAIHTTIVFTVLLGILITAVAIAATPFLLRLMETPADVFDTAKEYLTVYFAGLLGLMLYNMLGGIFRAMGDSQRPLYVLMFCAAANLALDLLFVVVLHWGVKGAALATILSQFFSALVLLALMCRTRENWRLSAKELKIDWPILKKIFDIGLPTGINSVIISISNTILSAFINVHGADCMAGWSAYVRLWGMVGLPAQSISQSVTTFAGQNFGAKKYSRIRKGTRVGVLLSVSCSALLICLIILLREPAIRLFNDDPNVVRYGCLFILTAGPLLWVEGVRDVFCGTLRGLGDARFAVWSGLLGYVVVRQVYLHLFTLFTDSFYVVAFVFPIGWVATLLMAIVYYPGKCRRLLPETDEE